MLPFFGNVGDFILGLPNFRGDVQVFQYAETAITRWQKWYKPKGVSMVAMLLIGSGGAGSGGQQGVSGSARIGGGGGGSGAIAFHIFPAFVLPDVLGVIVPNGGIGGLGVGGGGLQSIVSTGVGILAGATIPNIIATSGGTNAQPGNGITGGNGGVATTKAAQGWAGAYSISTFTAGQTGANGGASSGAVGGDVTAVWNTTLTCAGAGGGGVNTAGTGFAGGNISLQDELDHAEGTFTPATNYLIGGTAGSGVLAGGKGQNGINKDKPFLFLGGAGGGSADGQGGGHGGRGGFGCGGGGGGGQVSGDNSTGWGGSGGPGLVIICSW